MKSTFILSCTFVLLMIDLIFLRTFAGRPESFVFAALVVISTALFISAAKEIRG